MNETSAASSRLRGRGTAVALAFLCVPAAGPALAAEKAAGEFTVGDRTWAVVPSIQCSVYPGPVVAIAGHAEGDADVEITVDYDPGSGFVEAKVTGGAEDLHLSARGDALAVEIDGKTVSGSGGFRSGYGGGPAVEGSFRIEC